MIKNIGNLNGMHSQELLALYEAIKSQLVNRGISKGYADPTGYYAEKLFCAAYNGAKQEENQVNSGHDVVYRNKKYQIKARVNRPKEPSKSRKYKQYMKLTTGDGSYLFDVLVFIVFEKDFSVKQAIRVDIHDIEDSGIGRLVNEEDGKCCLQVNEATVNEAIRRKLATDITDKFVGACLSC